MTVEMHPARWGDPAAAAPAARRRPRAGRLAFGAPPTAAAATGATASSPRPRSTARCSTGCAGIVGADHVVTDDDLRRRRTRGKSTPDLLRDRAGDFADAPDAVVRPADHDEVAAVRGVRRRTTGSRWCPFGGGTCVTGGLAVRGADGFAGLVSLDLVRMKRLLDVDPVSMTATLEPGLRGPEAEALLGAHGLTLGHFPQSFEFATIGGFAATRSSGQASAGFGRFDAMVVGLTAATPAGELRLGSAPASAAGPGPAPAAARLRGHARRDHRA